MQSWGSIVSDSELGGMAECAQYLRHISQFNYYIYQISMRHDSTQSTPKTKVHSTWKGG